MTAGHRGQTARGATTRQRVLAALAGGPVDVTEVGLATGLCDSAVRRHLEQMAAAGEVVCEPVRSRRGRPILQWRLLPELPITPTAPARGRERKCLCCGKSFPSEGPHNRLCKRCREIAVSPFDYIPAA